ncbi:MAG: hypothetical protein KAI47_12605, partial [Deltaproteobacteria bacterium]|nr:hypothetical protein [Deltaproteobacteria bacterium]
MSLLRWIPLCCCAALLSCAPHPPKTRVSSTTAAQAPHRAAAPTRAAATQPAAKNPLLQASTLPFHFPPFDRIKQQHFAPAFARGLAAQRAEAATIAHNPKAPTFDNTIVAMERSGRLLDRVAKVFFYLNSSNTNDALQKLEVQIAPKLAAHQDAILLDARLFARVDAVYRKRQTLGLDPESAQLLERYETMFARAGA